MKTRERDNNMSAKHLAIEVHVFSSSSFLMIAMGKQSTQTPFYAVTPHSTSTKFYSLLLCLLRIVRIDINCVFQPLHYCSRRREPSISINSIILPDTYSNMLNLFQESVERDIDNICIKCKIIFI